MKASLQSLKSSIEEAALSMQGPEVETHVPKGCTNLALLGKHMKAPLSTPTRVKVERHQ
jgi:hypothetical protein